MKASYVEKVICLVEGCLYSEGFMFGVGWDGGVIFEIIRYFIVMAEYIVLLISSSMLPTTLVIWNHTRKTYLHSNNGHLTRNDDEKYVNLDNL